MFNYLFENYTMFLNNWVILSLVLIPLLIICLLFFFDTSNEKLIKNFSLVCSSLLFILSFTLLLFTNNEFIFQYNFLYKINWFLNYNISFIFGIDAISLSFILLTSFSTFISILISWNNIKFYVKFYIICLFLIEWSLFNVFIHLDLLFFYISFESVLIPMFCFIGIWGSRLRKTHALYLFILYTMFGSIFFLIAITYIYLYNGSFEYFYLSSNLSFENNIVKYYIWIAFFLAFAIKIPMVPFHTRLPEAHVEAPTAGSVILAGISSKMGGYAMIRSSIPLFHDINSFFVPLIQLLSIIAIIYISLITIVQIDLKKIIAYSSIAHMSYVILGLFSLNIHGKIASILIMISHGLISSGLSICIGYLYDRYGTRLLYNYTNLANFMPIFAIFFFFFILANTGSPGFSSFIGEFLVFSSIFDNNIIVILIITIFGLLYTTIYCFWSYNRLFFGNFKGLIIFRYTDINKREIFILSILAILITVIGFYPQVIIKLLI